MLDGRTSAKRKTTSSACATEQRAAALEANGGAAELPLFTLVVAYSGGLFGGQYRWSTLIYKTTSFTKCRDNSTYPQLLVFG